MIEPIFITFLRHGRSRADDEGVYEGRYDSPLTDVGISQVKLRAEEWKSQGINFDRIITSPLQRANQTARIISSVLGSEMESELDWMEFNNGPLAGLSVEEGEKMYPKQDFRNPYQAFWETGESEWEFYTRAAKAVEKIVRLGAGKYLVVGHGGIINQAMRTIFGVQPSVNMMGAWFAFKDLGFLRTLYRPDRHQWVMLEFQPGFETV
jgi:2,3-bisphosphoglycerate-dependent phosphoglycerate mutase